MVYDCVSGEFIERENYCENLGEFPLKPEDQTHLRQPDILVDQRKLDEYRFQCAILPDAAIPANNDRNTPLQNKQVNLVVLRASLGTANVGDAKLHMRGYNFGDSDTTDDQVRQVLTEVEPYGTNGHRFYYPMEPLPTGLFIFHENHDHIHSQEWGMLRLVEHTSACTSAARDDATCIKAAGEKLSFCALDLEPVDDEINDEYGAGLSQFPERGGVLDQGEWGCERLDLEEVPADPSQMISCQTDSDCPPGSAGSYCAGRNAGSSAPEGKYCYWLCYDNSDCPGGMVCHNEYVTPGACKYPVVTQGITPGHEDVYRYNVSGQYIAIGNPAGTRAPAMVGAGIYYLEGEWDSSDQLTYERNKANNIARVVIDVPAFGTPVGQDACNTSQSPKMLPLVDCVSNPGNVYCLQDYLNCEDGRGCPTGLVCKDGFCGLPCFDGQTCPSGYTCAVTTAARLI